MLKSATVANEALQAQAAASQRDLAAAQEAAAAAASYQQRAVAAEKAAAEARKEAQAAQATAAALEERLQAAEDEMDRITGAVPPTLSAQNHLLCRANIMMYWNGLQVKTLVIARHWKRLQVPKRGSLGVQGQWRRSVHGAQRQLAHTLRSWRGCR